eukprot:4939258-Amphidinium_carterae.1
MRLRECWVRLANIEMEGRNKTAPGRICVPNHTKEPTLHCAYRRMIRNPGRRGMRAIFGNGV